MSVRVPVEFLAARSPRPVYYPSRAGREAAHRIDQPMTRVTVDLENARHRADADQRDEFGLHPAGFERLLFPTQVTEFLDQTQLKAIYEADVDTFLEAVTGGYRVPLFDHTVRAADPQVRDRKQVREPTAVVHNDYSARSDFVCLREHLGDEADSLAQGRFQILNIWR